MLSGTFEWPLGESQQGLEVGGGSGSEKEPRQSGARGQTWPAQDKHRLEIKRKEEEAQPER
jgi:hypothetical protein